MNLTDATQHNSTKYFKIRKKLKNERNIVSLAVDCDTVFPKMDLIFSENKIIFFFENSILIWPHIFEFGTVFDGEFGVV